MEFNQNPNQEQTKVPPPPTPEVSIRTLGSDRQSVASGDPMPTPEVVIPKLSAMPTPPSIPTAAAASAGITMLSDEPVKTGGKKMLWVIITIVVFAAIAAVGYFVIYPLISSSTSKTPDDATTQTPVPAPAPIITRTHTSNFITPAAFQATAKLSALTATDIKAGLSSQESIAPLGQITEIVIQDSIGNQVAFSDYVAALVPSFVSASPVNAWLEDDFTAFVFKDDKGVWPGYVVRRQQAADSAAFNQWVKALEQTTASEFFVSDPGALAAFNNGTIGTVKDRFAAGSNGASFSYAVAGDYLVIATNFEGMKEGLKLLGY